MRLEELRLWILSSEGWKNDIDHLSKLLVQQDFPVLQKNDLLGNNPEWERLLLVASILAKSENRDALEAALTIAQAGFLISKRPEIADSSLLILSQLSNQRAAQEAIKRGFIKEGYEQRLGISARILSFREEMENKIFLNNSSPIIANKFQNEFWQSTLKYNWLYASAPTAAGKSFIVLKYLINQISLNKAKLVIYVAPTRALVSEVEQKIRSLAIEAELKDISISSIPIKELYDLSIPSVLIFTQERLHIFLNSLDNLPKVDILVIDEVQKLNEGMRGVILQDAMERVLRIGENSQIICLSPSSENPEDLFKDAPDTIKTKVVDIDQPMVSQNIIWASQRNKVSTKNWHLELKSKSGTLSLGDFDLDDRPTTLTKKMALIASKLCKDGSGVLIYANEPSEAEEIAEFLAELLGSVQNDNLKALSDLAKDGVHKNFKLVRTVKSGVAFHYGNMPSLVREEIEENFNRGDIKFLVCTSTLIEGVNLSCKTIFVQRPRKGRGKGQMEPQDFWNLAGRAGRWGKEFQGNVICVDPDDWKQTPPQRSKFKLKKQTEEVLRNSEDFLTYLKNRTFETKTIDQKYEAVLAYLITIRMRDNSLSFSPWSKNFDPKYIKQLDDALSLLTAEIDIPLKIIEKHSGISAVSMQNLLNYFRSKYKDGKKSLERIIPKIPANEEKLDSLEDLIPQTPESDNAYNSMADLLRRIHLKLYPAFGVGNQTRYHAVLILNWMRGYTLKRLIEKAIKYESSEAEKKDKLPKNEATIIRDTMKEVEEIARFKAPKYISCYTDILKIFLAEQNKLDLYPSDYPFDLFLEFGVMTKTLLSLVSLGLSRMSATELGKVMISSEYTKEECLNWIKLNIEVKELPAFVKKEINKKLSAQLI